MERMKRAGNALKVSAFTVGATFLCATLLAGCSSTGSGDKTGLDDEATGNGVGLSENDLNSRRDSRFGSGSIPTAEGEGMFRDVHFDYDSFAVSDEARHDVSSNAEVLKQNPSVLVTLEGHCDERGTNDYNLALGAQRAKAVQDLLLSYGISGSRIETISYGEELPLNPNHTDSAFAENRRVHFSAHGAGRESRSREKF